MTEIGPFVYQEYDEWTQPPEWDVQMSVPGETTTKAAIRMKYKQFMYLDRAKTIDPNIDTRIW